MNILYVYDGDWPQGATRVAKETRSFARAGHDVHLIARNELHKPRLEREEWMTVHRLPAVAPRLLNRVLNFPYFFNPVWIAGIRAAALRCRADCIVVADLPLAPTAVWVGRWLGLPVHYDMAEVYPEFLRGLWDFDEMGWSDHLVRNPALAEQLELYVFRRTDLLFVVSDESRDRCIAKGVAPERIIIVGNTPDQPERLIHTGPLPADVADLAGRRVVLFVGILIGDRGVADAIEAVALLAQRMPEAVLVVVGDGPERPLLEERVRSRGLEAHVRLLGWKEHSTLAQYYAAAHVGILPFKDGSHVRITLANKLFDYMGAGLPVVATDLPPMRRIIEEADSGLLAPAGDPQAFADALYTLLVDEPARARMARSGQQLVQHKYAWQFDEERMVRAVEQYGGRSARTQG